MSGFHINLLFVALALQFLAGIVSMVIAWRYLQASQRRSVQIRKEIEQMEDVIARQEEIISRREAVIADLQRKRILLLNAVVDARKEIEQLREKVHQLNAKLIRHGAASVGSAFSVQLCCFCPKVIY